MSDLEGECIIVVNQIQKRKKGVLNTEGYKRNLIKTAKLKGDEHVNWAGKTVEEKQPGSTQMVWHKMFFCLRNLKTPLDPKETNQYKKMEDLKKTESYIPFEKKSFWDDIFMWSIVPNVTDEETV